ncbi:MAG: hypothetical protein KBC73_20365 [Burkholderiaceae bacterium]|nr:hypothetical protein [Burkholderiaceae bacterium]
MPPSLLQSIAWSIVAAVVLATLFLSSRLPDARRVPAQQARSPAPQPVLSPVPAKAAPGPAALAGLERPAAPPLSPAARTAQTERR